MTIEKIFALESYGDQLSAFPQTVWVSGGDFARFGRFANSSGHCAQLFKRRSGHRLDFSRGKKYLFLEDVQDPGNVGTMIRTADAAGLTGVIVSRQVSRYL